MEIELLETDPDRPIIDLLVKTVEESHEVKDRIDAAIVLIQYLSKWKANVKIAGVRNAVKEIMRDIATNHLNPISERIRAAAVSL